MAQGVPAPVAGLVDRPVEALEDKVVSTVKRKTTAYQRRYKAAFKRLKSKYQTKAGKWKKAGFKALVKAAHREAKK
jgi:hypothetical protein